MTTADTISFIQEEILHLKRSVGFHQMKASQSRADVLGRIHQMLDHRLDNIRVYADRPNPNGQEILALVKEISTKLQEISIHD